MRRLFLICLVLALPSYLFGGTVFEKAEGQGTSITWKTADETSVNHFVVFRREWQSGGWGQWAPVNPDQGDVIPVKGSGSSYSLEDTGIFKTAERFLEYRIEARKESGEVLEAVTYTTSFNGLTSTAKRTWGSIKAMFR